MHQFDQDRIPVTSWTWKDMVECYDDSRKQAEKETIERSVAWLEENVWEYTGLDHTELSDAFRQAMEQEPKNYRVRLAEMPVVSDTDITWRDIKSIVKIADDLLPGHDTEQLLSEFQTEEAYYKEVLKRFKEGQKQ